MDSKDNSQNDKSAVELALSGIIMLILIVVLYFLIGGFIIQFCWNYLMPFIFGLPQITFLQSIVLLILARILFA